MIVAWTPTIGLAWAYMAASACVRSRRLSLGIGPYSELHSGSRGRSRETGIYGEPWVWCGGAVVASAAPQTSAGPRPFIQLVKPPPLGIPNGTLIKTISHETLVDFGVQGRASGSR